MQADSFNNTLVKTNEEISSIGIPLITVAVSSPNIVNPFSTMTTKFHHIIVPTVRAPFVITDTISQNNSQSHLADIGIDIFECLSDIWNYHSGCDKYDYAMAVFSGVLSGLIDSFFVRSPLTSPVGEVTDGLVDKIVMRFAQFVYQLDEKNCKIFRKKPENISSAIGFLEERYRVCYDARYASDFVNCDTLKSFCPNNHHLKSLAHCPDFVGLFFSILDQITGKATIVNGGRLIRLSTVSGQNVLNNGNLQINIISGIVNWFGHLMSDIAGSSGTRGHVGKRGMGIPFPGYELFQFYGCDSNVEKKMMAKLMDQMYQHGYDFRFGIAMSIPITINTFLTTLLWGIRQRFGDHR